MEFPYKKYFLNKPEWYIKNLLELKPICKKGEKGENYVEHQSKKSYSYDVVVPMIPNSYHMIDIITDYFTENQRIKALVKGEKCTPLEFWEKNKEELLKKTNDPEELRDLIWSEGPKEATQFKISSAYNIMKCIESDLKIDFSKSVVLDPSAGWGDRLILFGALGVKKYIGYDPNTNLQRGYQEIIETFKFKAKVNPEPFEEVIITPYSYDIVFTSPPYFDVETYTNQKTQSIQKYSNQDKWINEFFTDYIMNAWGALKRGGVFLVHIGDSKNLHVVLFLHKLMENFGAKKYKNFGIQGQKNILPMWSWVK
jgi:hypothetical protein